MRIVLGLAGLAVALLTWGIAITVSQSGLPYLDKDAGALITWLLFCPAVLCFLPLAGMALQRSAVAAVWWVAVAPVAGAANFFIPASLGTPDPDSRWVVWVLSFFWACPVGWVGLRSFLATRSAQGQARRSTDEEQP